MSARDDSAGQDRRARRLLAFGGVAGIAAGALSALVGAQSGAAELPPGVIVEANGRPILAEEYQRVLGGFANDRREAPSAQDRARLLEGLIDEELLLQHALAEGLVTSDRPLREAILRAMIESAVAESASRAASEEDLRALYREASPDGQPGAAEPPPFETARPALEQRAAARARADALRQYLEALRARARIERSAGVP